MIPCRRTAAIAALVALCVALTAVGPSVGPAAAAALPSPPASASAAAVTSRAIRVSWTPPPDSRTVAGYRVWRGPTPIATLNATARAFTATGLTPSTNYLFAVRWFTKGGAPSAAAVAGARTFTSPIVPDPRAVDTISATTATALLNAATTAGRKSTVRYGPDATYHLADVYRPRPELVPAGGSPVILFLHGGGWTKGDRAGVTNTAVTGPLVALLARGWTIVSADYRLAGPGRRNPAQIRDVRRAIKFLKHNASRFAVNPKRVFVAGASAGAHLALLAASSCRIKGTTESCVPEFEPAVTSPWIAATSPRVAGAVAIAPVTDVIAAGRIPTPAALRNATTEFLGCSLTAASCRNQAVRVDPAHWLDPSDPPVYLAFGTKDGVVAYPTHALPFAGSAERTLGFSHAFRFDRVEGGVHALEGMNAAALRTFLLAVAAGYPVP